MVDTIAGPVLDEQPPAAGWRRRIRWIVAAVILAALLIGSATAYTLRYARAEALSCSCGLGWFSPDAEHSIRTEAGWVTAQNVRADPSRRQSFFVMISNDSPVTQTFLGEVDADNDAQSGQHGRLEISTTEEGERAPDQLHYTSGPVSIRPGGQYALRYSLIASCVHVGEKWIFDDVRLRVRSGWFTRTEIVDFAHGPFVITGTPASEKTCPG